MAYIPFVDAIVSVTSWLGIRFSMKKADGRFHCGYYKFDTIFSLFSALTMVAAGLTISDTGPFQYLASTPQHSVIGGIIAAASRVTAALLAFAKDLISKRSGLACLPKDRHLQFNGRMLWQQSLSW